MLFLEPLETFSANPLPGSCSVGQLQHLPLLITRKRRKKKECWSVPSSPLSYMYICQKLVLSLSSLSVTISISISALYNQTTAQHGSTVRWVPGCSHAEGPVRKFLLATKANHGALHALWKPAMTSKFCSGQRSKWVRAEVRARENVL